MKKFVTLGVLLAAWLSGGTVLAGVVFSDNFSSGSVGSAWIANENASLSIADDTSGLGSGNALFVGVSGEVLNSTLARFNTVTLANAGDWIQMDMKFRYNGITNAVKYSPMIGLYTTAGTLATVADDAGYVGWVSSSNGYPNVGIGNDTGADSSILAGADVLNMFQKREMTTLLKSGEQYTLQLKISRTAEGAAKVDYLLGGDLIYSMTGTDTTSPVFSFDQLGIRSRSNDFVIDDVIVTTSIPEPATIGLVGFASCLLFIIRRRISC